MQVVIEMSEEKYKEIHYLQFVQYSLQNEEDREFFYSLISAIRDGIAIPKGHNILDENTVVMKLVYGNLLNDDVKCGDVTGILKDARIIKTDKENK